MNLNEIKNKLFDKQDLSFEESSFVFNLIMNGEVEEIDTTSILIALKMKKENKDEIHGAAKIMREKSIKILSPLCNFNLLAIFLIFLISSEVSLSIFNKSK